MIEGRIVGWGERSGRQQIRGWHAALEDRGDPDEHLLTESLLESCFARYPSAFGGSRAGGYYQIICPQCGSMIAVPAPQANQRSLYIQCGVCGWEDRLGDAASG